MDIGFTGTREGMTDNQTITFLDALCLAGESPDGPRVFHHGDCIGADAEAHSMAIDDGFEIHIHPPTDEKYRAFCVADKTSKAKPYLQRDHEIVDASDIMIACPKGPEKENPRSGTWATIRYALKVGKPVLIIMPKP